MGLYPGDLEKVGSLSYDDAYRCIRNYYSAFIGKWNSMTSQEKAAHIFGNGRTAPVTYVDNSNAYILSLTSTPTLADTIALAKHVIGNQLEYAYHNEDERGIKMGAYAHYVINTFNDGKLF